MARWLFKQEPSCYSYDDLERDGMTVWDGVANALALQNLRKAQAGEQVFFYHTGKEKAIVGVMEIIKAADRPRDGTPRCIPAPLDAQSLDREYRQI